MYIIYFIANFLFFNIIIKEIKKININYSNFIVLFIQKTNNLHLNK